MTEQQRHDQPVEGDRELVDQAMEEAPAKGIIDERDPDPPEPSEPA